MRWRDESGSAMVTVVLVIVVVGMLGVASATLADQNSARSARGRDRVGAAHAAEAGVNRALVELAKVGGADWCGVGATPLPGSDAPGGQTYTVEVLVPDASGGSVPCATASAAQRSATTRLVRATGTGPAGGANQPARVMEAQVVLEPVTTTTSGGYAFTDAIFSGTPDALQVASAIDITGDGGDNADVYSGFTGTSPSDRSRLGGNSEYRGDVVAQGALRIDGSAEVLGDVVARGDIVMDGGTVVHGNVTSTTGSISLSGSARIDGTARAATTVSTSGGASVGTRLPDSPSAPPPTRNLPEPPASFPAPGWPEPYRTFPTCEAFNSHFAGYDPVEPTKTNRANFVGTYHVVQSGCTAQLPGGGKQEITMTGPAAIVTAGCFEALGSAKVDRTAGSAANGDQLLLVSLTTTGCGGSNGGIKVAGGAMLESVPTLLYARNQAEVTGGAEIMGQIYARSVKVAGGFDLFYRPIQAQGFVDPAPAATAEGFTPKLVYLREVNGG